MNAEHEVQARYALQRREFSLDVNFGLPLRGVTGVFGPSGAGKTSLLRCIAGLERPAAGKLVVAGKVWQDKEADIWREPHQRNIGYVFQEPRLFQHLDVRNNIEFGQRRRGKADGSQADHVIELLGLELLLGRKPVQLSGGEAQRVAIARALLCAPKFVLMDEPLASLDQARKDEILPFLDRLHAESLVPVIYVSHNIDEICRLCDHLLVMQDGSIVGDGALQDVLMRTDLPVLAGMEAGTVIEGQVRAYDGDDGLLQLTTSAGEFQVPGTHHEPGAVVRLRVRANDVSLCRVRPKQSTILNIVPALIDAIDAESGSSMLVRLTAGHDKLLARVTRRSVRELGLSEGDEIFAQIKSVAVRSQSMT